MFTYYQNIFLQIACLENRLRAWEINSNRYPTYLINFVRFADTLFLFAGSKYGLGTGLITREIVSGCRKLALSLR